jgi:hypothetical protein
MNFYPIIIAAVCLAGTAVTLWAVPALRRAIAPSLSRGAFVAAITVLGVSALGLNATVSFLQVHFRKLALPLAVRSLNDATEGIPSRMGPWIQVSKDEPIDPEMEQVLGTDQYLFRDYVDSRVWPAEQLEHLRDTTAEQRDAELATLETRNPLSVIRASITYYTGLADTVAHIPERCMVADGYEPSSYDTETVIAGNYPDGRPRNVSFRFIHFEDQTARGRVARDVAYLFHVDGVYDCDSLAVRQRLASLTEPYGYYAKVELMTTSRTGMSQVSDDGRVAVMTDFLSCALPELERCLPDWQKIHRQPAP